MHMSFASFRMTELKYLVIHNPWRDLLFLSLHGSQTLGVEFQQVAGVVFGFGGGSGALKADSASLRAGAAVAGGHGDEFH